MTIPLLAEGIDAKGQAFRDEARVVSLNRHGARIQFSRLLESGQTVRLVNLLGHGEAEFRVVEPRSPLLTEKGGEYGVESMDSNADIWAIEFQPVRDGEAPDAKALLECRRCHKVALTRLTLTEVDTLRTIGLLGKYCRKCNAESPWGYAEAQGEGMERGVEARELAEPPVDPQPAVTARKPRLNRRVYMQLRLAVRGAYTEVEITRTEDISRGGLCFLSEKTYIVGTAVTVVCPIHTTRQDIELPARIVRSQNIDGSNQRLYAVQFEPASELTFAEARRGSTADA